MIRFRKYQAHGNAIARDLFVCEWADCPRRLFGLDCFRFSQCLAAASGALAQRSLFHNDAAEVQFLGLEQPGSSMELHPEDSAMVIVVAGKVEIQGAGKTALIESGRSAILPARMSCRVKTPDFADFLLVLMQGGESF